MNCSFCETTCRSRASFRRHLHLKHERDLVRTWENRRPVDRIVPVNDEQLKLMVAHLETANVSGQAKIISQSVGLVESARTVSTGDW